MHQELVLPLPPPPKEERRYAGKQERKWNRESDGEFGMRGDATTASLVVLTIANFASGGFAARSLDEDDERPSSS